MNTNSKERQNIISLDDFQQIKKFIHQNNRLTPTTDKKQHPQFKNNSYINSSKTTLRNDREQQKFNMQSNIEILLKHPTQCSYCLIWKKWAVQQQKIMLQLQNKLIARQSALQACIRQLKGQITQKNQQIQQFQQKCKGFSENIAVLTHNNHILQVQMMSLKQDIQKFENMKKTYQTPAKNEKQQLQNEDEQKRDILKIKIQNASQEKQGLVKASTIATKNIKNIQNNNKSNEKINKKLFFGQKKDQTLEQIRLQNQILKDYNNALIQQLQIKQKKSS